MKKRILEITDEIEKNLLFVLDEALKARGFAAHDIVNRIRAAVKEEEAPHAPSSRIIDLPPSD